MKEFLGYLDNQKLLRSELELDPKRAVDVIERLTDEILKFKNALEHEDQVIKMSSNAREY